MSYMLDKYNIYESEFIVGNCFHRQIHFGYKKLDENLQVFSINLNSIYYIKRTCTSKSHQYFHNVYEIQSDKIYINHVLLNR